MWWFWKKSRIDQLERPAFDQIRKRVRIVVIDDHEESFPLAALRKEGYAIDYWPQVDNLNQLESGQFDIIILDIQNVAKHLSNEDGLGILKHLKNANPVQIVVAFSSHKFDLSKNEFWKLADDSLSKPVDAVTCKRVIDDLVRTKMNPEHFWLGMKQFLQNEGANEKAIRTIEKKIVRGISNKSQIDIRDLLGNFSKSAEVLAIGMKIAQKIYSLYNGSAP